MRSSPPWCPGIKQAGSGRMPSSPVCASPCHPALEPRGANVTISGSRAVDLARGRPGQAGARQRTARSCRRPWGRARQCFPRSPPSCPFALPLDARRHLQHRASALRHRRGRSPAAVRGQPLPPHGGHAGAASTVGTARPRAHQRPTGAKKSMVGSAKLKTLQPTPTVAPAPSDEHGFRCRRAVVDGTPGASVRVAVDGEAARAERRSGRGSPIGCAARRATAAAPRRATGPLSTAPFGPCPRARRRRPARSGLLTRAPVAMDDPPSGRSWPPPFQEPGHAPAGA